MKTAQILGIALAAVTLSASSFDFLITQNHAKVTKDYLSSSKVLSSSRLQAANCPAGGLQRPWLKAANCPAGGLQRPWLKAANCPAGGLRRPWLKASIA